MKSLQDKIVKYLADNGDWVEKGVILEQEWKYDDGIRTYMANTADRELRSAESGEDGESRIAVKPDPKSVSVLYKFIPPEFRKLYIPFSQRKDPTVLFRIEDEEAPKQRTLSQNKAIHKLFSLLSDDLNEKGLDMKVVLKPSYQIWWTPQSVKEYLWKPLQEAMYQKKSTIDLETKEIDKIFKQLAKILGEHHGIEMSFPSVESTEEAINSLEKMK